MNRCKITEREFFTNAEKEDVLAKTKGGVCAHCGKPIFIGYQFSVDHFIPLDKGGCNRIINLVPLCKKCNAEKGIKVYSPDDFLSYLKPKYMEEIQGYYNSYIKSFNYVSRNSLIAQDDFFVEVPAPVLIRKGKKYPKIKYKLQRAEYKDLDEIYDYYVKYLKKYNALDDIQSAKANIMYWYESGCIYFVKKNNEVKIMAAYNVVDVAPKDGNYGMTKNLDILVFPYYTNIATGILTDALIYNIPEKIATEQNLGVMPILISGLVNDTIFNRLSPMKDLAPCTYDFDGKVAKYAINVGYDTENHKADDDNIEDVAPATIKFFSNFESDVELREKYRKFYEGIHTGEKSDEKNCVLV